MYPKIRLTTVSALMVDVDFNTLRCSLISRKVYHWMQAGLGGSCLKLGQIAERLDCELKGDANIDIQRVAGIDEAQPAISHFFRIENMRLV